MNTVVRLTFCMLFYVKKISKVPRQFLDRVKNVNPMRPIIDTCTLDLHEMKTVKYIYSYYCILKLHTQYKKLT